MKTVKILGDDSNKFSDTSSVLRFSLLKDGVIQDVTGKIVSVTLANANGYLFDVTPKNNGTEVKLDFSDAKLKKLTPDTYKLEINVTNADGDVEVYPSDGAMEFTVGRNLKSQTDPLVPQVTFDDVLKGVDEKINHYISTIAKGDKGDTGAQGPAGKDGVTPDIQVGGRNLLINTATWEKDDRWLWRNSTISGSYGVLRIAQTSNAWDSPTYEIQDLVKRGVINLTDTYTFSTYARNTSDNDMKIAAYGSDDYMSDMSSSMTVLKAHGDWQRVSVSFKFIKDLSNANFTIRWETGDSIVNGTLQLAGYKLEKGTIPTDWTTAPEDMIPTANALTTRVATFTDFNDVAKNMNTYSGNWQIQVSSGIANGPYGTTSTNSYVSIQGAGWNDAGSITFYDTTGQQQDVYIGQIAAGNITWYKVAKDATVVHNTGNETIAGNKTITGQTTMLSGNNGLRVSTAGFQKTTDGGKTWTTANI